MTMTLIDADNHYYETRESFTRHMEPALRERAIRPVVGPDGAEQIMVGDRPFRFLPMGYDLVPPPGRQDLRVPVQPEWLRRAERVAVMDRQGLEAMVAFPTIALFVEQLLAHDPVALYANLRAFNRWVLDEWGFGAKGRVYAAPLLSLRDRDQAVAEVDWALGHGARVFAIRPGHAHGRSPGDVWFDPLWARLAEAGAVVAFHVGDSGYRDLYAGPWGLPPSEVVDDQSALQWVTCYCERPMIDTLAALVLGQVFQRFPRLSVMSLENGSAWVPYLLSVVDRMAEACAPGSWPSGPPRERPSDVLRRHLYVSPFLIDPMGPLVEALGASQIVFGSDYPHGEGLSEPASFARAFEALGPEATAAIMGGNARRLLGL